jgi:hypothetical protein
MAAATYDLKSTIGANRAASSRAFESKFIVDASVVDGGDGFGVGESAEFCEVPAGALVTGVSVISRTAAGDTCTIDVGDEADPDGFLDGGDAESTADTLIALAGTEAYVAAGGKFFSADTGLRITVVNANAAAVIEIVVRGVMLSAS